MSDTPIRLLVADDHTGFRSGLRALLALDPGLAVVGEASTGHEAVTQAQALQPDVILMDFDMPELDGVAATRQVLESQPHVGVLVLTMAEGDAAIVDAVRAGARGYLLKGADRAEIGRAIRAVASGQAIFGPDVARRLRAFLPSVAPSRRPFPELTDRELEVLELVARGASNRQIEDRLAISPKTVRNHVSNILAKLAARDRAEVIVRAREAGFGGETAKG